jgi:hypothetical protein
MKAPKYINKHKDVIQLAYERWFDFKDGGALYKVSNKLRIKSFHKEKERILTIGMSEDKYLRVQLKINGKKKVKTLHTIIAEVFVPNPLNLKEVNHKDGNKLNCHWSNLEHSTRSNNIKHAFDHGLKNAKGENNTRCKLDNKKVKKIFDSKGTCHELAKIYNVSYITISDIRRGYTWSHITGKTHQARIKNAA